MEASKSEGSDGGKKSLSPEVAAALRKKESLLLARTYLLQQIQASQHPRHREMLQNALTDLEKQVAGLEASGRPPGDS